MKTKGHQGPAQNKMKQMMQYVRLLSSLKRLQKCTKKWRQKKKQEQKVLQAEEMRQVSLETFGETRKTTKSSEEKANGKTSTKVKCTETMKYLRERAAQEDQMKMEEMSIREKELEL